MQYGLRLLLGLTMLAAWPLACTNADFGSKADQRVNDNKRPGSDDPLKNGEDENGKEAGAEGKDTGGNDGPDGPGGVEALGGVDNTGGGEAESGNTGGNTGGNTAGNDGTDTDANANGGIEGDGDQADGGGGITTEEGELIKQIPGVEVVRVGVNFEDLGFEDDDDNDKDYNDAVLCFSGKFKVQGTSLVSIRRQTVIGTTSSISGCQHTIRVDITHKDGSKEPTITYNSREANPVNMKFKVGSKLEVFMTPTTGCNPGVERNMHSTQHTVVKPNVCNTTGG